MGFNSGFKGLIPQYEQSSYAGRSTCTTTWVVCKNRLLKRLFVHGGGENDKKVDKVTYVWAIHSLIRVFELWMIVLAGQIEQIVGERNKPHTKLIL